MNPADRKADILRDAERSVKYLNWAQQMPALSFPADWQVTIVPPFGNAAARFWVAKGSARVSVYADFEDNLGCVGQPYWEIHPGAIDDTERFLLNESGELMAAIGLSIASQLGTPQEGEG